LTGIDDADDENIETVSIALAIQTDEDGNNISNVALSSDVSLDVQISDDEAPVVSFSTSEIEIPENAGSTVVTANSIKCKTRTNNGFVVFRRFCHCIRRL
jgi:hypothetical protein